MIFLKKQYCTLSYIWTSVVIMTLYMNNWGHLYPACINIYTKYEVILERQFLIYWRWDSLLKIGYYWRLTVEILVGGNLAHKRSW